LLKSKLKKRLSDNIPTVSAEEPGIAYTHTYGYHLASLTLQLTPAGIMAVARFYIAHESLFGMKGYVGSS
jgi:hypothetical protein